MEVLSQKQDVLFDRKDVIVSLPSTGPTPSRTDVVEELAKKFGSKELICVQSIGQKFGHKNVVVNARIYGSKSSLQRFEPSYLEARGKPKEKKGEEKK